MSPTPRKSAGALTRLGQRKRELRALFQSADASRIAWAELWSSGLHLDQVF